MMISPRTLRRRMREIGLRCKRPRYFYEEKDPHRAQKGAIVRRLKQMPDNAVLLFEDEIIVRLFPVLRRAWALRGEQAKVAISGRNARRVLFGTINPRTGHRILMRAPNMRQGLSKHSSGCCVGLIPDGRFGCSWMKPQATSHPRVRLWLCSLISC